PIVVRRGQVDEEHDRLRAFEGMSSRWPGLNWRPTVYETVALPLSYSGKVGANWYPRQVKRASAAEVTLADAALRSAAGWREFSRVFSSLRIPRTVDRTGYGLRRRIHARQPGEFCRFAAKGKPAAPDMLPVELSSDSSTLPRL